MDNDAIESRPDENAATRVEMLVTLGKRDLAAAMRWIDANLPIQQQEGFRIVVVQELCITNLELLPEGLRYIGSSDDQKGIVQFVSREWARRSPAHVAEFASSRLTGAFKSYALNECASQLSASGDFESAVKIVDSMPYSSQRSDALSDLAFRWGGGNIEDALAWAKRLELPEERLSAMKILVNKLGELKNTERLTSLANSEAPSEIQRLAVCHLAYALAQRDGAEATARWVNTLPASLQTEAQYALVRRYAEGDLAQFTKYISTLSADIQINAAGAMSAQLAKSNTTDAAKWVMSLPEGEAKDMGISSLVAQWYNIDSFQLSEWVNSLKRGAIRDIALASLVSHLRDTDLKAAMDVANQIDNTQKKLSLLQSLGSQK
jgi:hypothetical protein